MPDLNDIYNDLKFWDQIRGDAKRTVVCEPHHADELRALIEERGYDHITVLASPACPEGQFLVIDEQALEASGREAAQRLFRSLYR